MNPVESILRHFAYAHLPERLQAVSRPICELAQTMASTLPMDPETTAGLRKLLEAKDCFVRADLVVARAAEAELREARDSFERNCRTALIAQSDAEDQRDEARANYARMEETWKAKQRDYQQVSAERDRLKSEAKDADRMLTLARAQLAAATDPERERLIAAVCRAYKGGHYDVGDLINHIGTFAFYEVKRRAAAEAADAE